MANDVKNDPKAVKTTVGVVTNAKIQDSQQPKMPLGVATAMFLATLLVRANRFNPKRFNSTTI